MSFCMSWRRAADPQRRQVSGSARGGKRIFSGAGAPGGGGEGGECRRGGGLLSAAGLQTLLPNPPPVLHHRCMLSFSLCFHVVHLTEPPSGQLPIVIAVPAPGFNSPRRCLVSFSACLVSDDHHELRLNTALQCHGRRRRWACGERSGDVHASAAAAPLSSRSSGSRRLPMTCHLFPASGTLPLCLRRRVAAPAAGRPLPDRHHARGHR